MNISDEAVEAAAKALARHKWPTAIGVWESFGQGMQDDFRDQARAALEAAAPYIAAQAWDEGAKAESETGCELATPCGECAWCRGAMAPNPYRSQA